MGLVGDRSKTASQGITVEGAPTTGRESNFSQEPGHAIR